MRSFDFPWRVAADYGSHFDLIDAGACALAARYHGPPDGRPVVGDDVAADAVTERIVAVGPRRSWIARVGSGGNRQFVAANLTASFVVTSPERREFSPRRVARYLVALRAGNVEPVIVLNKCEAGADASTQVAALREIAGGAPVVPVSALRGTNCEALDAYLCAGATVALCGSSGVGKSTLLNRLAGESLVTVQATRDDGRGRHTTTVRRLIVLASGAAIVDTPGMRAFAPWARGEQVDEVFGDIADLAATCRFADCTHETEPECAVRDAADTERLDQWRKLKRETEWLAAREEPDLAAQRKRYWKRLHKAQRAHYKMR